MSYVLHKYRNKRPTDDWARLGIAIEIAAEAHAGQKDRSGKPYILHPLHLMNELMYDPVLANIAVLHDVIEDSKLWTMEQLRKTFGERIAAALYLLTHDKKDTYQEYIDAICWNLDAITVKRKDLEHNSCITRLKGVTSKDIQRAEKYHKAFIQLGNARNVLNDQSN